MWTHSSEDIWRRRSQFFLGGVLPERLKWLNRVVETGNMIPTGKKVILFGAGAYGQKALDFFGKESVYCFVDNDRKRVGALVKGVPVISFEDLVKMDTSYQIVLCVGSRFLLEIAGQMENAGIKKYSLFLELWRRNWRRREMPTLGREAIYQMVDEYRACQEGKRLIFFGAGKIGREALAYCRKEGISVSYIADNNSELWGSKVGEVEVISPAQIYELQPFLIVITCDQVKEIAVQMEEYKLKQYISYFLFKSRYSKADRASSEATSVERACNWILQNQQKNGGVSAFSGSLHEYPEVTGYIIPTMLQYGFQDEAMAMAQYLSAMANPDGSFSASDSGRVYLFDTAQALRGLNAIRKITDQYASLQQKTGEYLFSALARHHGLFPKNYTDDPIIPETIMLFALPPMLEYAQSVNSGEKTTLVFQAAERYLQEPEALSAKTLTHFLAYQIDGLIDLGYSEAVKPIFERLLASQREDGAIPAYEGAGWACITGCSQLAICLYKLGMRDPADRLMAWVERYMEADGGFLGSVGPGADYFEDREPSWAVKFYLDAYERMICAHFDYEFAPVAPAEIDAENGEVLAVLEELQGGERVLEVGCGKGRILKRIHERFENCKLKGVDISKEMLSHVPNFVETSIGNMEFLPYADGKFDLVYTVECIEHSVNLRAAVRELARVCKPGGKIVIIDKQQTSWGRLATPPWEHWPDRAMLEQMLRNYCSDVTSSHICLKGYDERDDMFVKWRGVK